MIFERFRPLCVDIESVDHCFSDGFVGFLARGVKDQQIVFGSVEAHQLRVRFEHRWNVDGVECIFYQPEANRCVSDIFIAN